MTSAQNPHPRHFRVPHVPQLSLAAVALLLLAGCSAAAQPVQLSSTPVTQATPMFASDEEALAAAELAFSNYMEVGDQIARDGGASPERLKTLVSQDLYEQEVISLKFYEDGKFHAVGSSGFDSWAVQAIEVGEELTNVEVYVCLRFSDLRILDLAGNDVTSNSRNPDFPMVVKLNASATINRFIVSSTNVWTGTNFC